MGGFLGVRRRSDRDKPVVVDGFFLFSVGKPGVLSTGICGHPVGCAVDFRNLSVRFFMHIHRTAGGVFFCCNARIRGLRGLHTAMHTVLFNIVFHRL